MNTTISNPFRATLLLIAIAIAAAPLQSALAVDLKVGWRNGGYYLFGNSNFHDAEGDLKLLGVGASNRFADGRYWDLSTASSAERAQWESGAETDFDFFEMAFTFGRQSESGAVYFGGYKITEADFAGAGENLAIDMDGFFFGGGHVWEKQRSAFAISGALSFMTGSWEYQGSTTLRGDGSSGLAVSLSAGYSFRIGKQSLLSIDYKIQDYTMTDSTSNASADEITEEIDSFGLNLVFGF